ncbi:MAG: DUF1552 domain-containing protein [Akkermansiaceae bacterium]
MHSKKPWHLNRRTFLRGIGATLALPSLECMGSEALNPSPKRLAAIYFPFGVSMAPADSGKAGWNWFPEKAGADFEFSKPLSPLESLRGDISILGGLSHPDVRKIDGHDSGDTFLTGCDLLGRDLLNVQSMDQIAASQLADKTRFSSLVMSTDGGVGEPTRSSTLSYNEHGRPIPALNQPRQIFERLFGGGDESTARGRRRLRSAGSMLDLVLDDAKKVRSHLGQHDKEKFDEYLDSVRQVEKRVERSQAWIDLPKPELTDQDRERLKLESDSNVPEDYVGTMYELIYLAFRTDSTRVATYQIGSMGDATSLSGKFPQLLGFGKNIHSLCHDWNKPNGIEPLGKWDQFLSRKFAEFLTRMRETPSNADGSKSLLDQTTILYGCSNSTTHNNRNYPLVLAGGKGLGFKHGNYHRFEESVPLSNLHLTMLKKIGITADKFADSNALVPEVLA